MADISMCGSSKCPSRRTCYRHTAPVGIWQSWGNYEKLRNGKDKCEGYWDNRIGNDSEEDTGIHKEKEE